jgi:hypothetical protein
MIPILQIIIAVMIIQIILYLWVANWIYNVSKDKNCTCANNWRRMYIVIYPIIGFVIAITVAAFALTDKNKMNGIVGLVNVPLFVGWILFYVFAVQYLSGLKRMKCDCATKNKSGDNVLIAYSVIHLSFLLIAFIAMIVFISMFSFANKVKG